MTPGGRTQPISGNVEGKTTWPHSLPALAFLARALHRLDLTESQKVGNSLWQCIQTEPWGKRTGPERLKSGSVEAGIRQQTLLSSSGLLCMEQPHGYLTRK